MNQRREPIRSRVYLDGAKGQPCKFRIPGVCIADDDTTVPCHLTDETFGMAEKADDTSIGDGCRACHDAMDGRSMVLSERDWLFYAFRALQRTIRDRVLRGVVKVKLDPRKPLAERPVPKRKPPAQRKAIPTKPMQNTGRPIAKRADAWGKARREKLEVSNDRN